MKDAPVLYFVRPSACGHVQGRDFCNSLDKFIAPINQVHRTNPYG